VNRITSLTGAHLGEAFAVRRRRTAFTWPRGTQRALRVVGDPALRTKCQDVSSFGEGLARLVDDMFSTMYAVHGVGLAANQIGVDRRVFVYDCPDENDRWHRGYVVNPRVISVSETSMADTEGCLSIPGLFFAARRPGSISLRGQDLNGTAIEVNGDDYLARCLMHESDHLNGQLFIDRLEGPERKAAMRAIRDLPRNAAQPTRLSRTPHL